MQNKKIQKSITKKVKFCNGNVAICILLTAIMLLTVSCDANGIGTGTGTTEPTDHLSLGERFLLELEYEQALFHFLALIEIEPKNPRGYTGAAQAHVGLRQHAEAIAILQLGLEALPDNADILNMLNALSLRYITHNLSFEQIELMRQLFVALKSEEFSTAGAIVDSDKYRQLIEKAYRGGIVIYKSEEISLAIYPNGNVYAGNLIEGSREGFGIWFQGTSDALQYRYFQGQWENDLPNGQGIIHIIRDEGRIERVEGQSHGLHTINAGIFLNGYFHGQFSEIWHMCNGNVWHWVVSYYLGIAQMESTRSLCDGADRRLYLGTHRVFDL